MVSQGFRTLVFTRQPQKSIVVGETSGPIQVGVLDAAGEHDRSFAGAITITLDEEPIHRDFVPLGPTNAVPKRLRARASGCVDAVSDIFYIFQK
jgi:hypothetical protein